MSMYGSLAGSAEQRRRDLLSDLNHRVWQSEPEPGVQALVRAACQLAECPAGLVSLLEDECVHHGWRRGIELHSSRRDQALCALAIEANAPLVIEDLHQDDRLAARQLARHPEGWRFYAALPVQVGGVCVASLCLLDTRPRQLPAPVLHMLAELALAVGELLTGRLQRQRLVGQAERECRTRRDMLSQLSHELRTPLNAILGFSQLMAQDREQALLPAQAQRLDRLRQAGEGLLQAFSDLLHMTRGGAPLRSFDLAPQPVAALAPWPVALNPTAKPAPAPWRAGVSAPAAVGADGDAGAPRRVVLYIEDEPLNVLLMQEIFRSRPWWQLHVAETGQQGVAQALALRPDLVLVDMNLPDFNGIEVLRQLRAAGSGLHCVVLSADAMPDQVQAARAAGFRDYWTKPVRVPELLHALAQTLG